MEDVKVLGDNEGVYLGRNLKVYKEHKDRATMYVGKVTETSNIKDKKVLVDSISPHAIFICGMRGSGKSYTMGVMVEELALKNEGAGVIVIDPVGVFWSIKNPNKSEDEINRLKQWGIDREGIKNVEVFIPYGFKEKAPKETWDNIFRIRTSEVTVEDWCKVFDIERFDTIGLLLERAIGKVIDGYETNNGKSIKGKDRYSIDDLVKAIVTEKEIDSKDKGFRDSTRRALIARLEGSKEWGIFDEEGTGLRELSQRGKVSILDTSFIDDNVRCLVVGILARNILKSRKLAARLESINKSVGSEIPVTWLIIDEAHTLVPKGGKETAATESLLEYVRQGRQPGCSIILATQQPSAIDSRILSQIDLVFCHKLIYKDDIKAIVNRMPSELLEEMKEPAYIKSLKVGEAIVGDKDESINRVIKVEIRPRKSQHEGRERHPEFNKEELQEVEEIKKEQHKEEDIVVEDCVYGYVLKNKFNQRYLLSKKFGRFMKRTPSEIKTVYYPLYKNKIDYKKDGQLIGSTEVYVDGMVGEILKGDFSRTRGFSILSRCSEKEKDIFSKVRRYKELDVTDFQKEKEAVKGLLSKGILSFKEKKGSGYIKENKSLEIYDYGDKRIKIKEVPEICQINKNSIILPKLKDVANKDLVCGFGETEVWDIAMVFIEYHMCIFKDGTSLFINPYGVEEEQVDELMRNRIVLDYIKN